MELVCGIDLGTSYFKVGLFNKSGQLVGLGRVPVETNREDPSRCELAIVDFWENLCTALRDAMKQCGATSQQIKAVGYSTQANSFTLLDKNNTELTPLILWLDAREKKLSSEIEKLFKKDNFASTTGIGIEPGAGFAIAKLQWLQRNLPRVWSETTRLVTISSYLAFKLTEHFVVDEGSSALLGIYDIRNHKWWSEGLAAAGLSADQLPQPLPISKIAGKITHSGATLTGLPQNIPLVIGSLDHYMAAMGAGLAGHGQVSESTGTVLAVIRNIGEFAIRSNCCTLPGQKLDEFTQLAFDSNGAGALEWYQRNFAKDLTIPQLDKLALGINPGCDGLMAKPNANTYPGLKGFVNVSPKHTHGHFARAITESVSASLLHLISQMAGQHPKRILSTGGGANSDTWLDVKANLIDAEFVRVRTSEPACCGAAMIAATALGWFENLHQISQAWVKIGKIFRPLPQRKNMYQNWHTKYQCLFARLYRFSQSGTSVI